MIFAAYRVAESAKRFPLVLANQVNLKLLISALLPKTLVLTCPLLGECSVLPRPGCALLLQDAKQLRCRIRDWCYRGSVYAGTAHQMLVVIECVYMANFQFTDNEPRW